MTTLQGKVFVTTFLVTGASCHTTFDCMKSDIQTQLNKISVYSSALQCKKVQSSIEKLHRSKKLRKTENFSYNLYIRGQVGFAEFNNTADNRANIGGTIIGAPIVGQ